MQKAFAQAVWGEAVTIMMLGFIKARFRYIEVMADSQSGFAEERAADFAKDIKEKMNVYSLGIQEASAILQFLTECGEAHAANPIFFADRAKRFGRIDVDRDCGKQG